MSESATIEQLPALSVDDLAGEEGRIRTAIADLFRRRRLVRTLIRGHEQAEQLIAKRDGKPVRESRLRTSRLPAKSKRKDNQ